MLDGGSCARECPPSDVGSRAHADASPTAEPTEEGVDGVTLNAVWPAIPNREDVAMTSGARSPGR